jgi:hypothetical protein
MVPLEWYLHESVETLQQLPDVVVDPTVGETLLQDWNMGDSTL